MSDQCRQKYEVREGLLAGRWEILRKSDRVYYGARPFWWVRCTCGSGVEKEVFRQLLRTGLSRSCGCLRDEATKETHTKHGKSDTPTYNVWRGMIQRCCNTNNSAYENYGGRGVYVAEEWRVSFQVFLDDMGEKPDGMTLERKDVNGGYSKDNCEWASRKRQANNRRVNVFITFKGYTRTISEWAGITGISSKVISGRLFKGWSPARILITSVRKGCKKESQMIKNRDLSEGVKGKVSYLTLIGDTGKRDKFRKKIVRVRCECGEEFEIPKVSYTTRNTTRCQECRKIQVRVNLRTHGYSGTRVYKVWLNMVHRCTNSKNPNYRFYGAKGVQVCQLWRYSFLDFLADMGNVEEEMTLDRIDAFGNYCPNNCRWAAREEQCRNRRNSTSVYWW